MSERPVPSPDVGSLLEASFSVHLDHSMLEELFADLEFVHLRGGEILMREGEVGDSMYAVTGGRLRSFVAGPDGSEQPVGEVGVGEWVGEMALITHQRRSATVRAIRDTELLQLTRHGFERIIAERPGAILELAQEVVLRMSRLMHTSSHDAAIKTIAVLAIDSDVSLDHLRGRLARSLEVFGPVLWLNRHQFDAELGAGSAESVSDAGAESRRIASWQSEQEAAHRFVVYEADLVTKEWSARCVRQADRIVLVGTAAGSPAAGPADALLAELSEDAPIATQELVLIHGPGTDMPVATPSWLRDRKLVRHTHVRRDRPTDFGRLGRLLAGRAVGLVLGGGGARGFAHIGVLRALEESAIPVDVIGGVSMGAIVAAQAAMGWDYDTMIAENNRGISENRLNRDLTLPLISLSSGRRFRGALKGYFGEAQIEDLWLSYLSVSCNLSTASTVTHRSGPLQAAVTASNAAPGILPPVLDGGDLLVDGGLVNNEPGDIVKNICGGPVIVVNVSPAQEAGEDPSYDAMPSPWAVLGHRLSPFHKAIDHPAIAATIMRSIMVGSRHKSTEVESAADYYLKPPIQQFRIDDYKKIEEIADAGYRYAIEQVASWQELRSG